MRSWRRSQSWCCSRSSGCNGSVSLHARTAAGQLGGELGRLGLLGFGEGAQALRVLLGVGHQRGLLVQHRVLAVGLGLPRVLEVAHLVLGGLGLSALDGRGLERAVEVGLRALERFAGVNEVGGDVVARLDGAGDELRARDEIAEVCRGQKHLDVEVVALPVARRDAPLEVALLDLVAGLRVCRSAPASARICPRSSYDLRAKPLGAFRRGCDLGVERVGLGLEAVDDVSSCAVCFGELVGEGLLLGGLPAGCFGGLAVLEGVVDGHAEAGAAHAKQAPSRGGRRDMRGCDAFVQFLRWAAASCGGMAAGRRMFVRGNDTTGGRVAANHPPAAGRPGGRWYTVRIRRRRACRGVSP